MSYVEGDVQGEKWTDRLPNAFDHGENGISGLNSPITGDPILKNFKWKHLEIKVFKRLEKKSNK